MSREILDQHLSEFVAAYDGMQQRDASWYAAMGTTVGGSELAALLGCNPYNSINGVINSKRKILSGDNKFNGGAACWWGTLFEDVICDYVSLDIGSPVRGDNICIQRYVGHRNSPDGYIVAGFIETDDEADQLFTTDMTDSCAICAANIIRISSFANCGDWNVCRCDISKMRIF